MSPKLKLTFLVWTLAILESGCGGGASTSSTPPPEYFDRYDFLARWNRDV